MGQLNFADDIVTGEAGEDVVIDVLIQDGCTLIKRNKDYRFDFVMERDGEEFTFEVKTDEKYLETGNFFIELESRDKKSGIEVTEADYFVIHLPNTAIWIIEVYKLKEILLGCYRIVWGGDLDNEGNPTSKGKLIRLPQQYSHLFTIYNL